MDTTDNDSGEEQHEMDEYKMKDGLRYQRLGKTKRMTETMSMGQILMTVLLLCLGVLLVVVIILQVVTISMVQQTTPEANSNGASMLSTSQMSQLMDSFNSTCGNMQVQNNYMQNSQQANDSELLHQVYDATQISAQKLRNIVQTLSNLEGASDSTKGAIDDILLVAEELLKLQNKTAIFASHVPVSCQDILSSDPDSPSGYYHVNGELVYCEMGELCQSGKGWTRLGHLDMTDSTENCPSAFRLYEGSGIRGCGRPDGGAGCVSVKLPSNGISYSEVCGKVVGYEYGTPDAVDTRFVTQKVHNDINQYYVDGVSITHGYPRTHIWTLMAGVFESYFDYGNCPCNSPNSSTQQIQSFVGNDYFCESGNPTNVLPQKIYAVDPLWDGSGCGLMEQACCAAPGLPWFHKVIDPTSDYIELRECGDENDDNEDVLVNYYDIYVK